MRRPLNRVPCVRTISTESRLKLTSR
jgi:hypothetical protein